MLITDTILDHLIGLEITDIYRGDFWDRLVIETPDQCYAIDLDGDCGAALWAGIRVPVRLDGFVVDRIETFDASIAGYESGTINEPWIEYRDIDIAYTIVATNGERIDIVGLSIHNGYYGAVLDRFYTIDEPILRSIRQSTSIVGRYGESIPEMERDDIACDWANDHGIEPVRFITYHEEYHRI